MDIFVCAGTHLMRNNKNARFYVNLEVDIF